MSTGADANTFNLFINSKITKHIPILIMCSAVCQIRVSIFCRTLVLSFKYNLKTMINMAVKNTFVNRYIYAFSST